MELVNALRHGNPELAAVNPAVPKLRVGLFADAPLQPRWMVEAFEKVALSNIAEVAVIAAGRRAPSAVPWSWRLYYRLDGWCFGSCTHLSASTDVRTHIAAAHVLDLPGCGVEAAALAAWRASVVALDLDVAFALGAVDPTMLDGLARHGVWRYCFGAAGDGAEDRAGVVETMEGDPLTVCGLVARQGPDDETFVYRSWSRTHPHSVSRTRQNILRKSTEFPARALRLLHGNDAIKKGAPADSTHGLRDRTAGVTSAGSLATLGLRVGRRALQKMLWVDQWFLAYRFGGGSGGGTDIREYQHLMPPRDRLWVDPFPIERNGRYFLFFEELPFATGKAHIAVVELRPDGTHSAPVRVLERDYHLSYPFLIELEGELYMVPETLQNRTVEVYRCIDFPMQWRLERVLIRGARFADATFYQGKGRWWMFVNIGFEGAEAYDELHVFHADRLFGEWRAHIGNPVKSDVRSARPAGRLFERAGKLYRPAQICTPLYGSGVSVNRVCQLSTESYVEQEEERILPAPDSGILGIHTVNRAGALSVMDAFMRRPRI